MRVWPSLPLQRLPLMLLAQARLVLRVQGLLLLFVLVMLGGG